LDINAWLKGGAPNKLYRVALIIGMPVGPAQARNIALSHKGYLAKIASDGGSTDKKTKNRAT
jgi:hypothetical protein